LHYRACTFLWGISYDDTISNNLKIESRTKEYQGKYKAEIRFKSIEEYKEEIKQAFELLSAEDINQKINPQILSKKSEYISN